jgi:hypothetical protein
MEELLFILSLVFTLQAAIKLSFLQWYYCACVLIILAMFNLWIQPYLLEQGTGFIPALLSDTQIKHNLVLMVTVESMLFIATGILVVGQSIYPERPLGKAEKVLVTCWGFPGLSIFAAQLYFQHKFLLWISDVSFQDAAIIYTGCSLAAFALVIIIIPLFLNYILLRIEAALLLLITGTVIALVVLNINKPVNTPIQANIGLYPLFISVATCISFAAAGYFINIIKQKK